MSGGIIDEEYNIFTVPNPALIGPLVDRIDLREAKFEALNVTGTFTTVDINATSITVTNATIANLNVASLSVANLGANAITPSPAGSGVSIDGVVIRDRPHYIVLNRSVATFEGANPASIAGVSIGLVPLGTGALIGAFPDGTAVGGDTRGDYAVDWQLLRSTSDQVAGAQCSTIGGGRQNTIMIDSNCSTISGGIGNSVNTSAGFTAENNFIGGGLSNGIFAASVNAPNNIICGGQGNFITDAYNAAMVGSQGGSILSNNGAFIGGGYANNINGVGDNCVITGGSTNNIVGGGYKNGILCGYQNTIANSSYSAVVGGLINSLNTSGSCIVGGQQNTVTNSNNCISFGTGNNTSNSVLGYTIGQSCQLINSPYGLAMGYGAVSNAFMAHTFCATDGGPSYNYRDRSHKFVDKVFEVYCTDREVHNFNTQYVYYATNTIGPQNPFYFMWIYIEPYQCATTFIHITGGGGNDSKTALGYGWTRCYWRPDGVVGTNWFNASASEDGGFGFNADVIYSGYYMGIRIYCGVGAGVRCNWTASVQLQTATYLFGI